MVLFANTLCAQEKAKQDTKPGDEMIYKYLCAETDKLSGKFLGGAKTIDEWKQTRPRHYQEYMDMLGLWPIPEKTPLRATVTGQVEAHGVVVEKIHFQSKPGLYVTANLYRPKDARNDKSLPAIVYVCGHSFRGRDGNKSAHQDHGFWYANNGYVCIVLDSLQLGEIPGVHHGTYGTPYRHYESYGLPGKDKVETRWWWHSIGYTPAGVEAWNGMRAIDYLETRPEVDATKIGVTGISGGGAATFWIAAADERVKVAVPVSGMSDLQYYIKDKGINGHCDCMFLYNTYQWDWTTIAAMVAPRPMLFANSDADPIFPMDGNRRVMTKLNKIYGMYGKPGDVEEYVSKGGHAYRPDLRIAIFKFFNKHLKGDVTTPVEDCAKYTPLKGRELRVFPEDEDLPKDAINGRIDETFVPMAKVKLPEAGKFEEWRKEMISKLRKKPFHSLPERALAAKNNGGVFRVVGLEVDNGKPAVVVGGGEGVLDLQLFTRTKDITEDFINRTARSSGLFLLGAEAPWSDKSPPNYVERSHVLVGRTIDTDSVWETCSACRIWSESELKDGKWKLIGKGQSGIVAAYAALFEPSIKEVIVINPPKSHKEGPHFLNVLRVLDIPEALGLLAPRPLTIIGGNDPAFDRTAEIYRLAGAADKLTRK
jgi:dienelactone hydrolase